MLLGGWLGSELICERVVYAPPTRMLFRGTWTVKGVGVLVLRFVSPGGRGGD